MLGKLEEEVLLATLQAGQNSLPSEIYIRFGAAASGRKALAFGAVYTTLTRMVAKGLLTEDSRVDDSGRQRRTFTVNAAGRSALHNSIDRLRNLGAFALAGG